MPKEARRIRTKKDFNTSRKFMAKKSKDFFNDPAKICEIFKV